MSNIIMSNIENTNWQDNFVEKGADLEHDRWARWQKHIMENSFSIIDDYDSSEITLKIPKEWWENWQRQITTSYSELSEEDKEKDRDETRNYIPLVKQTLQSQLEEVKQLIVKEINIARSEGKRTSRLTSLYNKISKL